MIEDAVRNAFRKKSERGWDKWPYMFWAIDLHDVIIPGTYTKYNEGKELYPIASEVLRWLSGRSDMKLILFTASHLSSANDVLNWLKNDYGINFDYVNENPECSDTELCSFKSKFYFDILLEDKAGFVGFTDWEIIKLTLISLGEWEKKFIH